MSRKWHRDRFTPGRNTLEVACVVCARLMHLPPSKAEKYVTCGGECSRKNHAAPREARRKDCLTCGKSFVPRPWLLRQGYGIYCSQACNVPARDAIQSPLHVAKRVASFRRAIAEGRYVIPTGAEHPSWKGGRRAAVQRRMDAGAYREANHRRRTLTREKIPHQWIQTVRQLQKFKCALCRTCVKDKYHMDHIVPLALGGKHERHNIQILCPTCNLRKNAKHPIKYAQQIGNLL